MDLDIFLRQVVLVAMGIASLATLSFPLMYSRFPWKSTAIGRALMIKASSTAVAVNVTFLLVFFPESQLVRYCVLIVAFTAISFSSIYLTYVMLNLNAYMSRGNQKEGASK